MNQPVHPELPGTNQEPNSIHGGTHGTIYICNRGGPFQTSMRGEAISPVKAQCPSVWECQDREMTGGGLVSMRTGMG